MATAYPLRCQPHFQQYLWGGRNLAEKLGKPLPDDGVWAESWEIIDHPHHSSRIINGPLAGQHLNKLVQEQPQWLLGSSRHRAGVRSLPLLLKYLDCHQVLSVQVHPDDHYASNMVPPDRGKTEAWYVVDALPGAKVYAGLKHGVTGKALLDAVKSNRIASCLHEIQPRPGDTIFIPAGTVHALGAGLLVAEIQQSSNTTFRLYDWNRTGPDGLPRPLHLDQAMAVIDFVSGPQHVVEPQKTDEAGRSRLVRCEHFCMDRFSDTGTFLISANDNFHLLTSPTGGVELIGDCFDEKLARGDSILMPAAIQSYSARLAPQAILLDMYVPFPPESQPTQCEP